MITEKRKKTVELMINNYWRQVEAEELSVTISLEDYLKGLRLTEEEIRYAKLLMACVRYWSEISQDNADRSLTQQLQQAGYGWNDVEQ
jgi:hypothetical protein